MIAIVVAAAFVLVVVLAAWSRRAATRAERRSVRTYGKALGVLADVSRRSDSHVVVNAPEGDAVARAHVHTSDPIEATRPAARVRADVPKPRVRLQPPSLPGHPAPPSLDEPDPTAVLPRIRGAHLTRAAERALPPQNEQAKLVARQRAINASRPGEGDADVPGPPPADDGDVTVVAGADPVTPDAATAVPTVPLDDEVITLATADAAAAAPDTAPDAPAPLSEEEDESPPSLEPVRPMLFDDALEPEAPAGRPRRELRHLAPGRENTMRRAATGAAAAVVVGALAVGGYEIAASRGPSAHNNAPTATTTNSTPAKSGTSGAPGTTTPKSQHTGTSQPSNMLEPKTQSSALVTYSVPATTYTLTLSADASGACWVGVEQSANGPYLWMDTLAPGATATYQATGAIFVRIGNPRVLTLAVNGEKVDLPNGRTQVYNASLVPASSAA